MIDPPVPPVSSPARLVLERADLERAASAGLVEAGQVEALWTFLAQGKPYPEEARFSFGHTLYYFGGLLAISAMSLFMTLSWDVLGPWGITVLAIIYGLIAWAGAEMLARRGFAIPAGILAALAVFLVPLATWSAQHALGLWPEVDSALSGTRFNQYHKWIDARWLTLELATLLAGGLALWRLRLPFLVMPVALTLWYMSMDLARWPAGTDPWDLDHARHVSLVFGLAMCGAGGVLDALRSRRGGADFATWLYLFGAVAAWGAITASDSGSEAARLGYALFNGVLVLFGAVIGRRVFTILGAMGVALYLGHLSFELFRDSLLFPLALSAIGLAMVGAGLFWQRHEAAIHRRLRALLPGAK
ncbi:hypothetical protein J5J86_19885 [Aquabacter sp. L1I39]|uniref:hypothetical protein n=1 Tax=Aquabacter sp. L1I39 TaxID=2820278 RepID=UPI001ADAC7AF|nr:hypothetical protein [Aquabacter sp. L1I39]QTL03002.1 hypothetical protein J5J86_19885 [Aquabacter sp. L1I39]